MTIVAGNNNISGAVENKYSIGKDDHPLEQAHIDAVELIKEKFDEMVTKHL
jgi:hypothetical protein